MESEANKRGRGNSIATSSGHPSTSAANAEGGPLASSQANESRSQGTLEIHLKPVDADSESHRDNVVGNPSSANQHTSNQAERGAASSTKELSRLEPPVTKSTLSELDINKIVNNPKLRHDINFDPDLHFRPNLDGDKGRRKTQKALEFWDTMERQLKEYVIQREQFEREMAETDWTLPATLKAIRDILETLVPQVDRASVGETFNVDLLMQQFRKGVADLVKLANWLSQLLKCHCAPMRDQWVDEMVQRLSDGDRNGDVSLLVRGLQHLLGVLEAMKLDVANHQIRCLRPLLIEDTVHFEQKFFMKKIALGRVDIAGAHAWYRRASSIPNVVPSHSPGNLWDFFKALVNLTLPSKASEMVPHTFLFDEERLIKLRSDMLDLINLDICMYYFHRLTAPSRTPEIQYSSSEDTPTTSFVSSPCDRPASPADPSDLSSPTLPSPHHFSAGQPIEVQGRAPFARHFPGRQPFQQHTERYGSATSSLSSSPSSTSSTPDAFRPTPLYLSRPPLINPANVRSSLVAILSTPLMGDKWKTNSPALALQILRSTTTPLTHLPQVESQLAFDLSNPQSCVFRDAENRVLSLLLPVLNRLVDTYTPLTSMQIFEAATTPRLGPGRTSIPPGGQKDDIPDAATRMAHIGILHWRVWAPLAYLVDPDADEDSEMVTVEASSMT